MSKVKTLTRTTATSTAAVAKRAAALVADYLPAIIGRVTEVDRASSLAITIYIRPAGRTESTKDPVVIIKAKPDYGDEVITLQARLTGSGDDAQLTLIENMIDADVAEAAEAQESPEPDFEDDEVEEAAATG